MTTKEIVIKSSSKETRIKKYLDIIHEFHRLTDKEVSILVELVLSYQEFQIKYPTVTDPELINKIVFDTDNTKKIREKLSIKEGVFHNYLTLFRKKGVIKDGKLSIHYIPPIESFYLTFKFI